VATTLRRNRAGKHWEINAACDPRIMSCGTKNRMMAMNIKTGSAELIIPKQMKATTPVATEPIKYHRLHCLVRLPERSP
jgi:hypothetical protein